MDRQIGVGVIGLGWMGRVHTSAYRRVLEHFPDLGVAPAARRRGRRQPRAPRATPSTSASSAPTRTGARCIDDPAVEAVSITLPNAMHREVALAAVEAGKHLWVEKPVGRGMRGHRRGGRRRPRRGDDQRRRLLLPLRARRRSTPAR